MGLQKDPSRRARSELVFWDTAVSPKVGWSLERTQAYFDWAAQVIAGVRGISLTLEALFDDVYMRGNPKGLSLPGKETPA